jgi:hypothetical protein
MERCWNQSLHPVVRVVCRVEYVLSSINNKFGHPKCKCIRWIYRVENVVLRQKGCQSSKLIQSTFSIKLIFLKTIFYNQVKYIYTHTHTHTVIRIRQVTSNLLSSKGFSERLLLFIFAVDVIVVVSVSKRLWKLSMPLSAYESVYLGVRLSDWIKINQPNLFEQN